MFGLKIRADTPLSGAIANLQRLWWKPQFQNRPTVEPRRCRKTSPPAHLCMLGETVENRELFQLLLDPFFKKRRKRKFMAWLRQRDREKTMYVGSVIRYKNLSRVLVGKSLVCW